MPDSARHQHDQRARRVFYSYAHEDAALCEALHKHLALLHHQEKIQSWHDRVITSGQPWDTTIRDALERADIILLLVSADFMASRYAYTVEMERALQLHQDGKARVIPIILRPGDYTDAPFSHLQRLPHGDKAITEWDDQDQAWTDVARGIRMVIRELAGEERTDYAPPVTTVPLPRTQLLGRDDDVRNVRALLADPTVRLLTLSGVAGVGKTRLAHVVADCAADLFTDGVYIIPATNATDPVLVMPMIAHALGLPEAQGLPLREHLPQHIGARRMLLVFDHFDQVLGASTLVAHLLHECRHLKILIASRVRLGLAVEYEYPVQPLPVPVAGPLDDLAKAADTPAVKLFVERAQHLKPHVVLEPRDTSAVVELCRTAEGNPLAIELIAARADALIEAGGDLRPASPLPRAAGDTSVAAAFAWTYDALPEVEQHLFQRLTVFVGGCTLDSARAVCTSRDDTGIDVLAGLVALGNVHLVHVGEHADGEHRFIVPDQLREFGLDKLKARGAYDEVQRSHGTHYLALVEGAERELNGIQQRWWLERLEVEHDNIRSALGWARQSNGVEIGLRLASATWPFWQRHGHIREGRGWLESLLARTTRPGAASVAPFVLARALHGAGALAYSQADYARARARLEDSFSLFRQLRCRDGMIAVLNSLVLVARDQGDHHRAESLHAQVTRLLVGTEESRDHAQAWNNLGLLARDRGDFTQALQLHMKSLALWRQLGDARNEAAALIDAAIAAQGQGDRNKALVHVEESIGIVRNLGDNVLAPWCLDALQMVAGASKFPKAVACLKGASDALRQNLRIPLPPPDRRLFGHVADAARVELGEQAFALALKEGQLQPWPEVVSEVLVAIRRT